jgi:hypothetical protein
MQYGSANAGELEREGLFGIVRGCDGIWGMAFLAYLSNRMIGGR